MKIRLAAKLATHLPGYFKARMQLWEWQDDTLAKSALVVIATERSAILRTLGVIREELDMNFNAYHDIVNNELLAGLSLEEIALHEPAALVSFALDKKHDAFQDHAVAFAAQENSRFAYFQMCETQHEEYVHPGDCGNNAML